MSADKPVIIVGAGIGGLASAISLASEGIPVVVVERSNHSGGKIRQEIIEGRPIDAGPTVLTMRWVFDELFERAGQHFDSHVRLKRSSRLARHFWPNGSRLDLYSDADRNVEAIADFAGWREAEGYRRFAAQAQRVYTTVKDVFLRSERPTLGSTLTALGKLGPAALWRVEGHRTMWNALGDYFQDPRLRQLFGRYATYSGSSPFLSPATLNVIAHVEREGVWLPEGGMTSVAQACERVARQLGVELRFGTEVQEIAVQQGQAVGIRTTAGDLLQGSAVLFNGDPAALPAGLLGENVRHGAVSPKHRSLSAVTTCALSSVNDCELDYHTVFFSDDYEREFIQLFHEQVVPSLPTVYVCAQDRAGFNPGPREKERLFLLINAPPIEEPSQTTEYASCHKAMFETLSRCGWAPELSASSITTTPLHFAQRFPASRGSLYGPASHGMLSPLARTGASSKIPGLYFAGGGAHPGAGVPMAATSGVLAARAILRNLASMSRSRSTAIGGGISTSSAMMESQLSS